MKNLIIKVALIATAFSLVGCSSASENTNAANEEKLISFLKENGKDNGKTYTFSHVKGDDLYSLIYDYANKDFQVFGGSSIDFNYNGAAGTLQTLCGTVFSFGDYGSYPVAASAIVIRSDKTEVELYSRSHPYCDYTPAGLMASNPYYFDTLKETTEGEDKVVNAGFGVMFQKNFNDAVAWLTSYLTDSSVPSFVAYKHTNAKDLFTEETMTSEDGAVYRYENSGLVITDLQAASFKNDAYFPSYYKGLPVCGVSFDDSSNVKKNALSVTMPAAWENFTSCFANMNITTATIDDGCKTVPAKAFENNAKLTKVNLPEGLTTIGDYAFRVSPNLSQLTLPSSITSMGEGIYEAYNNVFPNSNYHVLQFLGTVPPEDSEDWSLRDIDRIVVPTESLKAYKAKYPQHSQRIFDTIA
jgi:hypothetical protein